MVFNEDGSGLDLATSRLVGGTTWNYNFRWRAKGNKLTLHYSDGGIERFRWRIKGGDLILKDLELDITETYKPKPKTHQP